MPTISVDKAALFEELGREYAYSERGPRRASSGANNKISGIQLRNLIIYALNSVRWLPKHPSERFELTQYIGIELDEDVRPSHEFPTLFRNTYKTKDFNIGTSYSRWQARTSTTED